MKSIFC